MSENECPYLIYKTSKSCSSCTGYRCISAGREKKVDKTQLETCQDINEYVLCTRYTENLPVDVQETIEQEEEETVSYSEEEPYFELPEIEETTSEPEPVVATKKAPCGCGNVEVRESGCPYQGRVPDDRTSCLGIWCYARNKNIRVSKGCVNWQICTQFLMAKYKGVTFYRDLS